jgi:hypothetical protein
MAALIDTYHIAPGRFLSVVTARRNHGWQIVAGYSLARRFGTKPVVGSTTTNAAI